MSRVAVWIHYYIPVTLKRTVGFDKPVACLIRNLEEAALSSTTILRRLLVDPAFRSCIECRSSLRSANTDLLAVPFGAVFHRISAIAEPIFAASARDGLGDRKL
jgi:hypothetical protein